MANENFELQHDPEQRYNPRSPLLENEPAEAEPPAEPRAGIDFDYKDRDLVNLVIGLGLARIPRKRRSRDPVKRQQLSGLPRQLVVRVIPEQSPRIFREPQDFHSLKEE
jgi:hypothetical protein